MSKQEVTLSSVGWATYWFGSLASRYRNGNRHLRALESKGLVRRVHGIEIVDGDGFHIPGRAPGVGWTLTDAGVEACDEWRDEIRSKGRGPR